MLVYRFRCWEQTDPTYQPSLVADCTRSGRIAYFESDGEATLDITSMSATSYMLDQNDPLIAVKIASRVGRGQLYIPLSDLTAAIAKLQDDILWRMLVVTTRSLQAQFRVI